MLQCEDFEVGDNVVYPHHGAGVVLRKESKELLGEEREYLTIKILHNDMTVQVPCENAGMAGLRRVIGPEDVKKVTAVLTERFGDGFAEAGAPACADPAQRP